MTAFDVVAGGPVADIPVEGGATIFAPAPPTITFTSGNGGAFIRTGASVKPPAASITFTARVASLRAGVRIAPPPAAFAFSTPGAKISISARIAAPAPPAIAFSAPVGQVNAGKTEKPPAPNLTFTAPLASVRAGVAVKTPAGGVTIFAPVAKISISARVRPPAAGVTFTAPPAAALAGNFVDASNTIVVTFDGGSVADGAVGEFPVADGPVTSVTLKVPPRVIFSAPPARVLAGAAVKAPAPPTITFSPLVGEVDSRRRKLRLMAIAS